MDMLTSSTNNLEATSVSSPSLLSPESDYIPTSNTTQVSNSAIPFSLASFLSTALNADSEYSANAANLNSFKNTTPAIHGFVNGENSPLNDFLRSIYSSTAPGLHQVTSLPDLPLPTAELPQNPETEDVPNSPAGRTSECSETSLSPTNPADSNVNSASEFFRSLGLLQMMHRNFSDCQLSGQTRGNSFDLDTDDYQHRQQNQLFSFIPPATSNGPFQDSLKQSVFPNHSDSSPIYPSAATMMFDQNSSRLPNIGELFEQQLSVGQALGLHNAAVAELFAANGKKPNGKIGNEKPMDGRKNRRNRTAFSKFQLDELEKCFQNSPYPDVTTRERVSNLIQLPEAKVQVWLKNRRVRQRKQLQNLPVENGYTNPSMGSKFDSSPRKQKENQGIVWNQPTNAPSDGMYHSILSTNLPSTLGFDATDFFTVQNLQRSIFEHLMQSSQSSSFSVKTSDS
ncbi:homeobox domain-containing protein [Ditylenchus destructor]|uniref:Homeobox domain-containing protein n=1 Tax=Ditylenchus destructor TaxID=166010 RepID=A0AAD4R3F6_9BILA|nr:homeobox domain-containing protein [Ditylenchus destructor]